MARRRTFTCSHCGAEVAVRSAACPECGSDAETGWSEDATAWAGDLPTGYGDDEDFDEDEALREAGLAPDGRPSREGVSRRRIALVSLLLVACAVLWLVWR